MTSQMQPYQTPTYGGGQQVAETDQSGNTAVTLIAWGVAIVTLGYMLPWAIAANRHKSNQGAIAVLNLLLGWTFIGWVAALVMACGAHQRNIAPQVNVVLAQQFHQPQQVATTIAPPPPAGWYPSPTGNGQAYWDGKQWAPEQPV